MSNQNKYLTTKQAAKELGVVVSTIYKYVKEGQLKPVYEDKWQIDETLLFHPEEIQSLNEKFNKPGKTTGEVAKELGVHPTTVASYISKGILKATKHHYKGRDLYFVSEEEIKKIKSSSVITKNFQKKTFYTGEGYFLFQSLKKGEQLGRIMDLNGEKGKVKVEDGRTLSLTQSKEEGFKVQEEFVDHKYISKRGYAKFIFPKPVHISSPIFTIIELFYRKLGHRNIKLEVVEVQIHMEVKPVELEISKSTHETEIETMEKFLVGGNLYQREEKVYVDTDLEPIMIHVPSILKAEIRSNADNAKLTIEEYVLEMVRQGINQSNE